MNDSLIDRMVDGELSPTQHRELLARLDDEPGGWRRLALAFVEAQVWRSALDSLSPAAAPPLVRSPGTSCRKKVFTWPRGMAIAASLMVAFGLGLAGRDFWRGGFLADGSLPTRPQTADSGQPLDAPPADRQMIHLVDAGGQMIELPLVDARQISPDWVRSRPNVVPPRIRHELERSGHRVEQRRVFFPVLLDNGQPAVVPIDEAEVQFVGERVIQ